VARNKRANDYRYRQQAHVKARRVITAHEYAFRNPLKYRAQWKVMNALTKGRLRRPHYCERCGAQARVDAHHDNYERPLWVRWLCRPCHSAVHREPPVQPAQLELEV